MTHVEISSDGTARQPETADAARAIHVQCDRALRRLRVLARERNDVLLSQALKSVRRAAELSAAQMGPPRSDGTGA
jgi:hypothetical protein